MSLREDDEIISEIRRVREEYAKKFDNDLRLMFEDIKKREVESGREIVRLPPRRPRQDQKKPA